MIYQHYKGGLYELITTANMESDNSVVAVYRCVESNKTWIKPIAEWDEKFKSVYEITKQALEKIKDIK